MHRFRARLLTAGLVAGFAGSLGLLVGCSPRQTVRPQAAEDPERDVTATVGSKTAVGNYDAIPVSGVGLVYDLKGTGGNPPPDEWRKMLETSLRKQKFSPEQVKQFLDDPEKSTSLVMVSAVIPRGARHGDKLDVVVTLPPGSRTTSLSGGRLHECDLTNYELAGAVRESMAASGIPTGKVPVSANQLMIGNRMSTASGPLVSGALLTPDGAIGDAKPTVAKVWGGATCLLDRPYYFLLNDSARQPQLAMAIAARLNAVFHGTTDRGAKVAEAKVQGQRPMVLVNVPPAYRLNHDRFLLVARQVPLVPLAVNAPERERLKQDLLRPETAVTAGVKLEALGAGAEDILRIGLEHENAPWVRFSAAQSLVYLGKANAQVAAVLGQLAAAHPAVRTHCLTALASQDDSPCLEQLAELMRKGDPVLRYGAFTALRAANDNHEAVRPRPLAGTPYALHLVAPDSDPLIHLRTDRRNEIVLFGTVWPILGKFSLPLSNEFTVSATEDGGPIRLTRVYTKTGPDGPEAASVETTCRADVAAVLKALAEMGGGYEDAIELVRRLNAGELLAAKVALDAAPRGLSIQKLALIARGDPTLSRADQEVERVMKEGGEMNTGGYDLPADPDTVGVRRVSGTDPANGDDSRALNRNPGSLIGR
jgi:hypothetical protein